MLNFIKMYSKKHILNWDSVLNNDYWLTFVTFILICIINKENKNNSFKIYHISYIMPFLILAVIGKLLFILILYAIVFI